MTWYIFKATDIFWEYYDSKHIAIYIESNRYNRYILRILWFKTYRDIFWKHPIFILARMKKTCAVRHETIMKFVCLENCLTGKIPRQKEHGDRYRYQGKSPYAFRGDNGRINFLSWPLAVGHWAIDWCSRFFGKCSYLGRRKKTS